MWPVIHKSCHRFSMRSRSSLWPIHSGIWIYFDLNHCTESLTQILLKMKRKKFSWIRLWPELLLPNVWCHLSRFIEACNPDMLCFSINSAFLCVTFCFVAFHSKKFVSTSQTFIADLFDLWLVFMILFV